MLKQNARFHVLIDIFKANPCSLKFNLLIYSALLASGFILCWRTMNIYFLSDDMLYIWKLFHEGFFYSRTNSFFRPLIVLSYWLDLILWKFNPWGYHVINVFFHATNAFLVFHLCRACLRLFAPNSQHTGRLSFLSACVFLVMPNHTEAVTWIAGRNDLIATFFMLLSLIAYCHYLIKPRAILLLAVLTSFAVSLLSKEIAIILPGYYVIFSISAIRLNGLNRKKITAISLAILSTSLILAGYFILRYQACGQFLGGYGTSYHLNIFNLYTVRSLAATLWRSFMPALPYAHFAFIASPFFTVPLSLGLLGALSCFFRRLFASAKSETWLFLCLLLCFLLSLLPTATRPVSLFTVESERYIYFPTVFVSMGLLFFISRFPGLTKRTWIIVSLILILGYGAILQMINQRWMIAGEQIQKTHHSLSDVSHKKVLFLNLPDNYQGAYMFHVAMPFSMCFFYKLITSPSVADYFFSEQENPLQLHKSYRAVLNMYQNNDYKEWQHISKHYQKLLQSKEGLKWKRLQTDRKRISETEAFKHTQTLYQKVHDAKNRGKTHLFQALSAAYKQSLQTPELKQWQALNQAYQQIQKTLFFKKIDHWNNESTRLMQAGIIRKWDNLLDEYYTNLLSFGGETPFPIAPRQIHILSRFDLLDLNDRVTVTQAPDSLTLCLENPQARFRELTGNPEMPLTQTSQREIAIHFPEGIPKDTDIFYYSESEMHKLVVKQ